METIKCIKERRSVRKFKDEKISHDTIMEIVDAASFAPSWKNTQIARYIVIEDKDIITKLADEAVLGFEYNAKTMKKAPALVIVTNITGKSGFEKDGSFSTSKEDRWQNFDAGIATATFCLAAHDLGMGTVIMGIFDEAIVKSIVNIPEDQDVAAILAIGYPEDRELTAPKRLAKEDLVSFI